MTEPAPQAFYCRTGWLAPILVVNPDPMLAVTSPSVGVIVCATLGIMPGDPAAPAMAVMPGHPDPVITLVPVTGTVIVRPIAHGDFEAYGLRLLHHRRGDCRDRGQKNQKFSFHIVLDDSHAVYSVK
jgi:hypothetical protein